MRPTSSSAHSVCRTWTGNGVENAHERGIKVEVIIDKSQLTEQYSSADFLANSGIPIKIDAAHDIAHNMVMVIDRETLISRSFNFTRAGVERNRKSTQSHILEKEK